MMPNKLGLVKKSTYKKWATNMTQSRCLRVLSIDGGGMRGVYTSAYLSALSKEVAARRDIGDTDNLDVGKVFDLIVGTSTGGIIACALAAGVCLDEVSKLYLQHGKDIFPVKMPSGCNLDLLRQFFTRPKHLAHGSAVLANILEEKFGQETMREVYERREIALAIPAVEMSQHHSWVFKTPHLDGRRDDNFRLVEICLATSAAPLYRSMALVMNPTMPENHYVFVDGGLWANNPVLVGMIDALQMTEQGDRIEIFALGTCQRPSGSILCADDMHRGLGEWKFGGEAMAVSLDAQQFAYDKIAKLLSKHVDRDCRIVRFPCGNVSAEAMQYLDLDETSERGMQVLATQAQNDVSRTLSAWDHPANDDEKLLVKLFEDLPKAKTQKIPHSQMVETPKCNVEL